VKTGIQKVSLDPRFRGGDVSGASEMGSVALHTFGCKVNQYESEELREQLRLGGYQVVPFDSPAGLYLINSCTVTAEADRSCRQLVRKILRERPESRVVVTGCYAERSAEELRSLSPRVEVFGQQEKPAIAVALGVPVACVEAAVQGGIVALAERTRAYIKVQDGCDAHCTYCIVPSVRPQMLCRAPELILRETKNLLARGFKEIVLTGVRLGKYEWRTPHPEAGAASPSPTGGEEKLIASPRPLSGGEGRVRGAGGWTFSDLVRAVLGLEGDFRLRLSSIEVTELTDELIGLAATNSKLCPFFHIPLQSGDDEVLQRMGRWYTAKEFRKRLDDIRRRIPDVALSTDVIAGFPGETAEQFRNTCRVLEHDGFSRLHAFRYSPRPGTPAERLPNPVEPRVKSDRVRQLVALDLELRRRYAGAFLNREVRVLIEQGSTGYTDHYVRVAGIGRVSEGAWIQMTPTRVGPDGSLRVR
jgi:threonylcarbamoyladenosine tRNA methylthiotransferase MtaB